MKDSKYHLVSSQTHTLIVLADSSVFSRIFSKHQQAQSMIDQIIYKVIVNGSVIEESVFLILWKISLIGVVS